MFSNPREENGGMASLLGVSEGSWRGQTRQGPWPLNAQSLPMEITAANPSKYALLRRDMFIFGC